MLISLSNANAGILDNLKTHYRQDVAACLKAVNESIPAKDRNIDNFRIKYEGPDKAGYRTVILIHEKYTALCGCSFKSNGEISHILWPK